MLFIFKFHTLIIIYLSNLCACINLHADVTYLIFEDEDRKAGRLRTLLLRYMKHKVRRAHKS